MVNALFSAEGRSHRCNGLSSSLRSSKKLSDASAQTLFTVDETETSMHLDMDEMSPIQEVSPSHHVKAPRKYSGLSSYLRSAVSNSDQRRPSFGEHSLHSMSLDSSFSSQMMHDFDEDLDEDESKETEEPEPIAEFQPLPVFPGGRGRRGMLVRQETYCHIPTFTWSRQSITQNGVNKVKYVPVVDDGIDHDISLRDLQKHKVLGEGMFGQVWLVSGKDRPYALKIQSKFELAEDDKVEFAVREKDVMSKLMHPFIIRLVKAYQDKHFIYLIMDFIKGGELWSLLHPNGDGAIGTVALSERQSKFYMLGLSDAIAYTHRRGFAYRDLKPENILIDAAGYPVLVDFGLAKRLEKDEKTFTMVGTPAYCSPEIINGEGHDRCTDYWSLGVIAYEMLQGESPFSYEGIDQASLYAAITEEDYPPLKNVSEDAEDFVRNMLNKDPQKRLGSRIPKDVINHEWFDDINLDAVRRRKINAPWVPEASHPLDTSHFDDWSDLEDKSTQAYPELDAKDEALFGSFDMTSDTLQ